MRNALVLFAVISASLPAGAAGLDLSAAPPPEHVREASLAGSQSRYPMNWSEEAAQSLGVKDGHWQAFSTTPSNQFEPSVSAGADAGGAMLKLSWH